MPTHSQREHFVPVRVADLVEFLATGRGSRGEARALPLPEQEALRSLAMSVVLHFHARFHESLLRIKNAYAPFDPDADTIQLGELSPTEKESELNRLFVELREILKKANYRELSQVEALQIMKGASYWGVELDVDWGVFDYLQMYFRGSTEGERVFRPWWRLYLKTRRKVPQFERLVIVLKQRPHPRLGKDADTKSVFTKIFKELPKSDLEMILPGTKIRLSKVDQGMIFYPLISGIGLLSYKLLSDVFGFEDMFSLAASFSLSWSLAGVFAGYGYKSYVSYTSKKTQYTLQLTKNLYYQVIDSNAGVFARLLDEAEEQEVREVLLAYFYLWQSPRPLSTEELDEQIEKDLDARLGVKADFEIADAIQKLEALGLVQSVEAQYRAVPLTDAVHLLARS